MFAERQVYVRSGEQSRYVVISRSLQAGVVAAFGVALIWLGLASYGAIASHLRLAEQDRELTRLEGLNRSLRAAAETIPSEPTADDQLRDMQDQLESAVAARDRATQFAETSAAEALELKRELSLAGDNAATLRERIAALEAELELASQGANEAPADGVDDVSVVSSLRSELDASARRLEEMAAERADLRQAVEAATEEAAASRDRVDEVVTELETARAEVERLRSALGAAEAGASSQEELEQSLAEARAEADQLQQALAAAEADRETLTARLEAVSEPGSEGTGQATDGLNGGNIPPEVEAQLVQLSADLESAREEVQTLRRSEAAAQAEVTRLGDEIQASQARASDDLQRLTTQLDEIKLEDGVTTVIPAFLQGAERVVTRLDQDLEAARASLTRLQNQEDPPTGLGDLELRLQAASQRISQLELVVRRMRARETALQIAISNVIPPPPPPAPR